MMELVPELGINQKAKYGEELCGDSVEVYRTEESTIVVLSDGLGSGVKANILSTLTTKIAVNMIKQKVPIDDVVETIVNTLPVCKVRKLAYSTFSILIVSNSGEVNLVEYDAPPVIKVDKGGITPVITRKKGIAGKFIGEARITLAENDLLILVSDGVTQAGLGGILPLGLGVDGLIQHLHGIETKLNSQEIANQIMELCEAFYAQQPGDDATVVTIKLRKPLEAVVLTGPPLNIAQDKLVVDKFMETGDVKIVCGGTTAQIVARELNKPLNVDFNYVDPQVPPIARIEGIDLVTEGVLTLSKGLEILDKNQAEYASIKDAQDGANLLVKHLLSCDKIKFMVGTKINPAHQNPELPLGLRKSIIEKWQQKLESKGKKVEITWY